MSSLFAGGRALRSFISNRTIGAEFFGYLLASVLALSIDVGLLWLITRVADVNYLVASAVSYSVGAAVHYLLSVRYVFRVRRLAGSKSEFGLYMVIGVFGLLVTQAVLKFGVGVFGLNLLLVKCGAIGLSFVLTYALRRALLFTLGGAEARAR